MYITRQLYINFAKKCETMKKCFLLLVCCLVFVACKQNTNIKESYATKDSNLDSNIEAKKYEIVDSCDLSYTAIKYKQKVNSFDVFVKIPKDSIHDEYKSDIMGRKAILTFSNSKQKLVINADCFADYNLIDYFVHDRYGLIIETNYIAFEMTQNNTLNANQSPFFFFDIDFDDQKELVICQWEGMGYKNHHAYKAYKINLSDGEHSLLPIKGGVFDKLDDYTEFDTVNKTIKVPLGIDMRISGYEIYGLNSSNSSIELKEIEEYDWEHTKGMKYESCEPTIYHYKIINGKKQLIKIDE